MASRVLNAGTGRASTWGSPDTVAGFAVVISTRPAGPDGHRPSRSAASRRSSSTTSHGRLVLPSQSTNRAATVSASPVSPAPIAADACPKPDSTDARLVATTQVSTSTPGERHSDSAKYRASWVLPLDARQSNAVAGACSGTSATAAPGTSADSRPGTLSGLTEKSSASGGTEPDQTGHVAA